MALRRSCSRLVKSTVGDGEGNSSLVGVNVGVSGGTSVGVPSMTTGVLVGIHSSVGCALLGFITRHIRTAPIPHTTIPIPREAMINHTGTRFFSVGGGLKVLGGNC